MLDGETTLGTLALVGAGAWDTSGTLDAELLARSDGEVAVLPTGAAYEHPGRVVDQAEAWFSSLGGRIRPVMVLNRRDAEDETLATIVSEARFIYLAGGSPLHIRSVLKDSAVFRALVTAWRAGAVVAGSSGGAMVLSDPMVDPRGGAFTVGLGLIRDVAVVTHRRGEETAQLRRTLSLAPPGCAVAVLDEDAAIVRDPDGSWRVGTGQADFYLDHEPAELAILTGRRTASV